MSPQETLSPVVPGAEAQTTAAATPETRAATESDAPIATQVLAADDTLDDDNDSAIGGDSLSSTASIASSIYKFRVENGRTYNGYGDRRYFMPNDEVEQDRLYLQHHLFQLTFGGGMFTAPIDRKKVHRILDAGTGTGIWAIDMGDICPESEVYGVDVSPIQPQFVPPNVKFEIDDLEKPWTFTSGFDFVFSRMMTGSFSNWRQYISHCYEFTNPGGYCEVQDVCLPVRCDDNTLTNTNLERYGNLMLEGSLKLGVGLDVALKTKQFMEEAGFIDVNQVIYKWPLNRWPANKAMKEIGLWAHEVTVSNLSGLSIALFTHGLGWSVEELEVFLADVRKDLKNSKIHSYMPIYVVVGRKPGGKDEGTVVV
ncbi:S-adenosyl-L-methionine-dependent methyltransferase [Hyaloscypha finlandica]|nr:S-adenosyl-L-methionine-dependent methyltransferase [Hyaloscypha finlandica]